MDNIKLDCKYPHIQIKSHEEPPTIFTDIYIDGHKINGVRSFTLKRGVGDSLPILTLDLNVLDLAVDSTILQYRQEGIGEFEFDWKTKAAQTDGDTD